MIYGDGEGTGGTAEASREEIPGDRPRPSPGRRRLAPLQVEDARGPETGLGLRAGVCRSWRVVPPERYG